MILLLAFDFAGAGARRKRRAQAETEGSDSGSGNESKSSLTSLPPLALYTVHQCHTPSSHYHTTLPQTGFLFPPHKLLLLSKFNLYIFA